MSYLIQTYRNAKPSIGVGTRMTWWTIHIGAVIIGIAFLVWVGPLLLAWMSDQPSPRRLQRNAFQPGMMILHVLPGAIALMIGPWQMSALVRAAYPRFHRWLGRVYVGLVMPSGVAALILYTKTDIYGDNYLSFVAGSLWLLCTILGVVKIRQHDVAAHRRWMMRSYAFAWTAIVVALYFQLARNFGVPSDYAWPASRWFAFSTVLIVTELIVRRTSMGTSVPTNKLETQVRS